MAMWVSMLKKMRWCSLIMGISNVFVIILGAILIDLVYPDCGWDKDVLLFVAILVGSCIRIFIMIRTGIAQQATATMIINSLAQSAVLDAVIRHERRIRYKRWLLWTRFLTLITVQQFVASTYLIFVVAKHVHQGKASTNCVLGHVSKGTKWQQSILVLFIIMVFYVATTQCFTGSDVLRWRSFYTTEDNAWKTHYMEVFDHGIREALCCLGRSKYLSVLEEDEVYSVAQLLGDLVTYRAAGTGHFELLAGLALFQRRGESPKSYEECSEAPEDRIQEATDYYPFAEAAYTGLLLDIGRNPVLFPCVWLYRQGILTPWTRNRCPMLQGDNWWRGHATAFLNNVNISAEALRQGRVNQGKCEAAYFLLVLHELKSVVIAVRGTETPEDLITDGLCRECTLSVEDLDGLLNNHIHPDVRKRVISSMPHYGHSGVVAAARNLFMQIEGNTGDDDISSESRGFLSSLLGAGCECNGYAIRIVGHSLGGAIASMLGLRLYGRYPNLHVYAYGPLPCMDPILADACSEFITSIVYNKEFSARLSVASIMRLRATALTALSQETTDSRITSKLARRFLFLSKYEKNKIGGKIEASHLTSSAMTTENSNLQASHLGMRTTNGILVQQFRRMAVPFHPKFISSKPNTILMLEEGVSAEILCTVTAVSRGQDQNLSVWPGVDVIDTSDDETNHIDSPDDFTNPFCAASPVNINLPADDPVSEFLDAVPSSVSGPARDVPEMFVPGLVIHIIPHEKSFQMPLPKWWRTTKEESSKYKAYVADRESFKDIIVSPSMFLDHLPWRCVHAMRKVLKARKAQKIDDGFQIV